MDQWGVSKGFVPHDDTFDAVPASPMDFGSESDVHRPDFAAHSSGEHPMARRSPLSSFSRRVLTEVTGNPAFRVAAGIALVVVICGVVTQRAWVSLEHVTGVDKPSCVDIRLIAETPDGCRLEA